MFKIRTRLTGLIVIVLLVIGGAVAWLNRDATQRNDDPNGTDIGLNDDFLGLENEPTDANLDTNTNLVPQIPAGTPEYDAAKARDEERLAEIKTLRDALEAYNKAKDEYPEMLDQLKPDYLADIPTNPTPGGLEYSYTPIGSSPYTYYSLYYSLEVGDQDIVAGDHEATPEGIATL